MKFQYEVFTALTDMGLQLGLPVTPSTAKARVRAQFALQDASADVTEPRPITCGQFGGVNRDDEPCGSDARRYAGRCPFHRASA